MEGREDENWEALRPDLIDQAIRVLLQIPEGKPIPPEDKVSAMASIEAALENATPLAQPPPGRIADLHDRLQAGRDAANELRAVMVELAEFHWDYGFEFSQRHEDLRHLGAVFDESQMAGAAHIENESPTYAAVRAVEIYCMMVQAHLPPDKGGKRDVYTFVMGSPMGQFVTDLGSPFVEFNSTAEMTGTASGRFHRFCEILLEVVARRELTDKERDRLLSQIQFSVDRLRRRYEALEDASFWRRNRDLLRHHDDPLYGDQRSEEADRLYREARRGRPRPRSPKK